MNSELSDFDMMRAQEALMALRGLHCSRCGRALDRNKKEYACNSCGIAYCPYCGKSAQVRCRHYIAANTYVKWAIYGKPCAEIPQISGVQGQTLDWSDRQKRQVFRDAYPLLGQYGQGLLTQPRRNVLLYALATRMAGPVIEVSTHAFGRYHHYVFAAESERALPSMKRALHCLRKGFSMLARTTPDSARFLVAALPCGNAGIDALCFSPDKTFLAAAAGKQVRLWETASGKKRADLLLETESTTIAFSPDSTLLIEAHAEGWRLWRVADGQMVSSGRSPNRWPSNNRYYCYRSAPDERLTCNERAGFLHDGASLADIADAVVTVRDTGRGRPRLTLDHRSKIILARFSPDGETLATVQKQYKNQVLLWRVPVEALQAKAPQEPSNERGRG
jgi:hypothetical protein